ncbi:hypothetical protein DFQ01_1273 [Paenibacillus cellulosilyticus]|uniref:Uncharacterized protein n=1 Tax=Paenibacillus cellulosilyticus TaxID=375489 RepID=A0A2V2YW56_9BACL|nr:hypothetical protein [Paenibacillus cellulosilyticus]PWV95401.1 hypothetical protein DFQ01_1273 [Paenibacillus cellulosilyticus]QKS43216.1 hypothetical protein HUB94_01715 [Paenibacillus cellulosilyticus]
MEMNTKKKRSYTVPVVLIMLTFSLIGNVFLYSQHLQNGQDKKQADGLAIINDGLAAKAHVDAALNALNGLEASTAADRPELLYKLGQASADQVDLLAFIVDARKHTLSPTISDEQSVNALQALNSKFAAIGAMSGELTAEDKQAIQSLRTLYSKLKEQLASFKLESGDKMVEMSVLTGGSWVDIGLALDQAIVDAQAGAASNG